MKLLMVCLGNICRSPIAHGLLEYKIEKQNLGWVVDSAGTGAYHVGNKPDKRSIAIATKNGIDLTKQRARQFTPKDYEAFDYIFVMDSSNYNDVIRLASSEEKKKKVSLILNEFSPARNMAVPDPYYGGDDGFKVVYDLLDQATDLLITRLIKEVSY